MMVEAHRSEAWNHTSHILAMLCNVNRDTKKYGIAHPTDFNPTIPVTKANPMPTMTMKDWFEAKTGKKLPR